MTSRTLSTSLRGITLVVILLCAGAAQAEPMKCSGESKTCASACATIKDPQVLRACATICTQRTAVCQRTGCWNNGSSTYCGLLRQ